MKTLILGGVRSGKSRLAQQMADKSKKPVLYIATAIAGDEEMQQRIESHKMSRPQNWKVIEEPVYLANVINHNCNKEVCILVDCLTLWITNLLLTDDKYLLTQERDALILALENSNNEIIVVSNETSMGIMPLGELTRRFCDEAGITNQLIAAVCDRVVLTVAGLPLTLKGEAL